MLLIITLLVFWNHHQHAKLSCMYVHLTCNLQLFLERLSEKVHATIPKGTVGDFEVTVLQESQDRTAREAMDICLRVLKESNKSRFVSYKVRNRVLIISHITFRDCRVHIFSENPSRNSCIQITDITSQTVNYFNYAPLVS